MPTPLPQYDIVSKGEPLQNLSDFKGLRVRGPGGIMGVLSKLGAVKTSVPFSEVRQSMDSGVIDAASFAPHAHLATKTYKVGKWATTNLNLGSANCPVVVNTEALNSLKPEHKKVLLDSVNEALVYYVKNYDNNTTGKYEKAIKDQGLTQVTFNAEQTKKLNGLSSSVRKDWIKTNSKNFDSQNLYTFTEELFTQ
jgi:TRAP-type C4-dicarboxylate transport system substrate-binding protein